MVKRQDTIKVFALTISRFLKLQKNNNSELERLLKRLMHTENSAKKKIPN